MSNQTLPTGSTITFTQQQLSNHNRSIETAERERIIKILQPYIDQLDNPHCFCYLISKHKIALIKGETSVRPLQQL